MIWKPCSFLLANVTCALFLTVWRSTGSIAMSHVLCFLQSRELILSQCHMCFVSYSLENWYYRILVLLTGNLKDAQVAIDALSIWFASPLAWLFLTFLWPWYCCNLLAVILSILSSTLDLWASWFIYGAPIRPKTYHTKYRRHPRKSRLCTGDS